MVSLDEAVTARLKRGSKHYEILVEPEGALAYKRGETIKLEDVLAVETIFEDANRGDRAAESDIINSFETTDPYKIADVILKHGELQLTADQRRRMLEEKKKKVIYTISRNAINPQTRAPHPPARIEKAMEEAKVTIDPLKNAAEQVDAVVKKISVIMPIKFTTAKVEVTIPPEFTNRSYSVLKRYGLKSEKWLGNGSLQALLEFPAGMQTEFFDRINSATQGKAEVKIL